MSAEVQQEVYWLCEFIENAKLDFIGIEYLCVGPSNLFEEK